MPTMTTRRLAIFPPPGTKECDGLTMKEPTSKRPLTGRLDLGGESLADEIIDFDIWLSTQWDRMKPEERPKDARFFALMGIWIRSRKD